MAGPYTLKNLAEVEDSAPKFGFEELGEARFPSEDLETEQTGLSHQRLKPGKRQGFAHRHEDAEEVYVVLDGSGRMKLDDELVELRRLDAIRVAPGVTRMIEAGPEGLELLVFGPRRQGDGEIVREWWTD